MLVRVKPRQDPPPDDGFGAQLQLLVVSTEPAERDRQVVQGLGEVGGVPGGFLGGQVPPQPQGLLECVQCLLVPPQIPEAGAEC